MLAMTCPFPEIRNSFTFSNDFYHPLAQSYEMDGICGDGGQAHPALPEGRIDTSYNTLYKLVSMSVNGPDSHVQEQNA